LWGTADVKDIAAAMNGILADVFAGKDLIALLIEQQMIIAKVPTDSHSFSTYIG
jgi:hypothetical protein